MTTFFRGLLLVLLMATTLPAADWPQWLGPKRDGVWAEDGILDTFPPAGPAVLWRKPIGGGYTGPSVANGRVFVMDRTIAPPKEDTPKGVIAGTERVLALDAKTGESLWMHEYDRTYKSIDRPMGPRTTPTVDGEHVFTLGAMGDLYCLEAKTGKPLWNKYLPDECRSKPPVWGYSAHLLVHRDSVIVLAGGEGHAVVAFEKHSGKKQWAALTTGDVGYSPPVIMMVENKPQLIAWLSDGLHGLNPDTGAVLWSHAHPAKGVKQMKPAVSIVTPKIVDDMVIVSSAYDGALAVKPSASRADIVWRSETSFPKSPDKLPVLMSTIIARGAHLYSIDANTGAVVCSEKATGKEVWNENALFGKDALFGSVFWVEQGDRVFCFADSGDLVILKLNPMKYEELGRAHILDPIGADRGRKVIWAHPAFANRTMIVRHEKEIICVSLAKG